MFSKSSLKSLMSEYRGWFSSRMFFLLSRPSLGQETKMGDRSAEWRERKERDQAAHTMRHVTSRPTLS
jgi:hypothetical protein